MRAAVPMFTPMLELLVVQSKLVARPVEIAVQRTCFSSCATEGDSTFSIARAYSSTGFRR